MQVIQGKLGQASRAKNRLDVGAPSWLANTPISSKPPNVLSEHVARVSWGSLESWGLMQSADLDTALPQGG